MDRLFFMLGSFSAFLAVALGAFGGHALKARLPADLLPVFEVGVRYQMAHALAPLAVAWAHTRWPGGVQTFAVADAYERWSDLEEPEVIRLLESFRKGSAGLKKARGERKGRSQ